VTIVFRCDGIERLRYYGVVLANSKVAVFETAFQIGRALDDASVVDFQDFQPVMHGPHGLSDAHSLAIADHCDFHDARGLLANAPMN
jgi:hypothetical protein